MDRQFNFHQAREIAFSDAAHVLHDEPGVLLGLARDAAMALVNQHEIAPHVRSSLLAPDAQLSIDMILGDPHRIDASTVSIPIEWGAVEGARWFPAVHGTFEVSALHDDRPLSDVSFFGAYTPRLGVVGAVLDAAATHRFVEDTLEAFFQSACAHLVSTIAAEADASTNAEV